jgi:hypothetical protein
MCAGERLSSSLALAVTPEEGRKKGSPAFLLEMIAVADC